MIKKIYSTALYIEKQEYGEDGEYCYWNIFGESDTPKSIIPIGGSGRLPDTPEHILIKKFCEKTGAMPEGFKEVYRETQGEVLRCFFLITKVSGYISCIAPIRLFDRSYVYINKLDADSFMEILPERYKKPICYTLEEFAKSDPAFKTRYQKLISSLSAYKA